MRIELVIILITIFMMFNSYHEGKYIELIKSWKKYYQIGFYAFLGLSLIIFVRKNPTDGFNLFKHAHKAVKYMPIEKNSADILTPLLDISSHFSRSEGNNNPVDNLQYRRMMTSGRNQGTTIKRSVSETKKKFVASNQNWQCAHCQQKLPAWFEVDHKLRLEHGGDNHINNLEALCRDCHGKKTAMESML